ncbi:MAG: 50S ribosomal protein L9 [Gammaproteobacteria bacterium CG11_big_fil_rev_8_21_14_0_20_46_22]|nr:MAG: 50S ribosomal protein L9 [Gammaproteobacteria bacterium CG12_big_fil_rev_8_21_14_0_65_46_12]PIR11767.1 MAG: 50S ribosomal protein L9 [Gammaproteobacteria bacterium CG11_big_fil_rev_8_21_14_0_20_46_22]
MEVILLERIRSLGKVGDRVNVKSGYARNFLVPEQKAVLATKENIEMFEARRAELEQAAQEMLDKAQARAKAFEGLEIKIARKAAEDGKLFGSVTVYNVIDAIKAAGVEIERRELTMPEQQVRSLGEYELHIELHSDVVVPMTLTVEAE